MVSTKYNKNVFKKDFFYVDVFSQVFYVLCFYF